MATTKNPYKIGGKPFQGDEKHPVRALPANWYTSADMYELERRAIFSKKWLLLTHKNRFVEPGDWLKTTIAGFEVVLCRNRKGEIHGFHNVCRHRAFPVVQGAESGNAKIFACKYHGWSYGLDGKLAKAPRYDELEGFDKTQNGMFAVHVKIDTVGFVWVNLDNSEEPEPWEKNFDGIDQQERLQAFNFEDWILDHDYKMEGQYNWKILADNFNECYHCPSAHPDLATLADLETLDIETNFGWLKHTSTKTEEQQKNGLGVCSTYFYPSSSVVILKNFMMIQRFLPDGPGRSSMQYQIFRNKNAPEEEFQLIAQMYNRIVAEDKGLCEGSQRNLEAGTFVNGELHPILDHGPLFFQKVNREAIRDHVELERHAKREIWPARQKLPDFAKNSADDEALCTGLTCQVSQEGMVW